MSSLTDSVATEEPVAQPQDNENAEGDLTPLRAHYLKKSLIQLQFGRELDLITSTDVPNVSNLSFLGAPFSLPPKGVQPLDLPFLKFIFRQFVLTFPFMDAAPKGFYSEKVQPFVDAMVSRNLASSSSLLDQELTEDVTRKKLLAKIERNMAMFLGSATKLVEREDVVRLTQADLDRLERLAEKRQKRLAKNKDSFEVNIVGVRTVVEKGRVRSRAHEEFIIRTRRSRYHDVYVSRRYGDFKTLANELAKRYPEENIRLPPAKDRTSVTVTPNSVPASAPSTTLNFPEPFSPVSTSSWDGPLPPSPHKTPSPSRLAREKNRLTLRSYLNSLLSSSIASSPVIKAFLLMNPITLTPDEREDARRREEADRVREEGRKKFAKAIASRVDGLRDAVKSVKGDILGKNGLTDVFGTIKVTPNIKDLPENYHAVVEWARISLASTAFHTFVASDDASETFAGLKRVHGLMPYFMLKTALKITNPIAMIRAVLDLFLAQPFGGRSLLQRMFTVSLTEEVRSLEHDIQVVRDKIDDPMMCDKIRQFVYAPRDIQEMFKQDALAEAMNIVTVVLRSAEAPVLSRPQMNRLAKAHKSHQLYERGKADKRSERRTAGEDTSDEDDWDEGPDDEDAWLIEDLRVLTGLYQKLRDKEQLIALIFEGFTSELLKDIITIFYSPLAKVYRAASIADSLGDMQNFINDLIKTVEQVEELSSEDPYRTVQEFVNLIQRHEQSFYRFVHNVHSKGEGLFDSLMRWIELFLTVIREGLGAPFSLEFLLPHGATQERREILEEVDKVALYHYKLKVLYEDKLRRRFGKAQHANGEAEADAEDEAAREMVNGVIGELSFGELVKGDADDLAAAETDEEDDETSSDYESDSQETTSSGSYETTTEDDGSMESEAPSEKRGRPGLSPLPSPSLPPPPPSKDSGYAVYQGGKAKKGFPAQVQTQHKASSSTASFASADIPSSPSSGKPPPAQQPARKRSLSLKSVRSFISLKGSGQDSKPAPPPVPRIPAALRSGASSPVKRSSVDTSKRLSAPPQQQQQPRPPPLRMSSSKTIRPGSPASSTCSSAYASANGSTSSLHRMDSGMKDNVLPRSPLAMSPQMRQAPFVGGTAASGASSSSNSRSRPESPQKVPVVTRSPTSTSEAALSEGSGGPTASRSSPAHTEESGAEANSVPPAAAAAAAGPTPPPKTQKKKKTQQHGKLEPPELKHIPQLLPVFVEMVSTISFI
ncbi:hypothetical protein EST38_g604 [Candolleomyces aberdarensis]|uniref:PX domain-containing protein n=1 Tax=Candolleomyces aberdarensis TaxID=2316362 RepID=A0A4Q2DX17_9AGAR|nr:hypothetical protein EST38_g604 [Candolleomyces aberdarensis]